VVYDPDRNRQPSRIFSFSFSVLLLLFLLLCLSSSHAKGIGLTAFLQSASPGSRGGIGFAVGIPLITEIITLEGEYSRTGESETAPSLVTWTGNVLIVSPVELVRLRPYFAAGFGVYRQAFASASELSFATTPGFGAFLRLSGPLHGRFEYRVIRLRGDPLQAEQKRFYAGLTLRL
jgi:hypothetical protein